MVRPDFRNFRRHSLAHSAKGSEWEDHKYVKKIDGVYYYPVGYKDGRTIDDLSDNKNSDTKNKSIDEVKNHFDQYLAKRGIDWRTLPKDEIDQMQRDIVKQLESGKETGTSEKSAEELAKDVMADKLGKGEDTKTLLGDNYSEVQKKINEMINGSTGSKKISEVTEESIKKVTKAAKNASNVHSGVNMDQVMNVYNKKKK